MIVPSILLVILSGCSAVAMNTVDASAPSIEMLLPRDAPGEPNVAGEALFPVLVKVDNFSLVNDFGALNEPNQGHIHYYLDRDPLGMPGLFNTGRYAESSEPIHYWPDIGRGSHTFWAELVNNDHTPLNPRAIARARISTGGYAEG